MNKNKKILIINGPNLNMLGTREPNIYGTLTLEKINESLNEFGKKLNLELDFFQSNFEGALVEAIQSLNDEKWSGAILNAAAYTHTSIALRDAALSVKKPIIEVHLSNPLAREYFRKKSYLSDVVTGAISGFGQSSYLLALYWFSECLNNN